MKVSVGLELEGDSDGGNGITEVRFRLSVDVNVGGVFGTFIQLTAPCTANATHMCNNYAYFDA
jgi:hypothetical protein